MIDRTRLRDQILESIRNAIITGKFKAAEKLLEAELSEQLRVSRTPVREAIRMLEMQGFIEVHPKNGTLITSFDSRELQDGLHVWVALEELALKEASRATLPARLAGTLRSVGEPDWAHVCRSNRCGICLQH
jgi:DNA-binding GntR family transcriptional regulator